MKEDKFWDELKQNCLGCWSGGTIFTKYQDGRLKPVGQKLNIRLKVEIPNESPDQGQWTVWNARKEGDTFNIPIRKSNPSQEFSMHKLWFENILLRISNGGKLAMELGFWDILGDGMRRTVVVEYEDRNESQSQNEGTDIRQTLSDVCIIQQKIKASNGFIGEIIVQEEASVLPEETLQGCDLFVKRLKSLQVAKSEKVQISSMERTMLEMSKEQIETVTQTVVAEMNGTSGNEERFTQTLQNGLAVSLPVIASENSVLYFGHHYHNGKTVVLELQFRNYREAHKAILHTFE